MANVEEVDSVSVLSTLTPPPTPKNNKLTVIETDDDTPLRPIFCLKRRSAIKEFDDKEDCFILDFNPEEDSFDLSKICVDKDNPQDSPDISLIRERGQVACRDYPHARHLCIKNPFEKTPHESYCKLCYCYVCDVAAPCKSWSGTGTIDHCHAFDTQGWNTLRNSVKTGVYP